MYWSERYLYVPDQPLPSLIPPTTYWKNWAEFSVFLENLADVDIHPSCGSLVSRESAKKWETQIIWIYKGKQVWTRYQCHSTLKAMYKLEANCETWTILKSIAKLSLTALRPWLNDYIQSHEVKQNNFSFLLLNLVIFHKSSNLWG